MRFAVVMAVLSTATRETCSMFLHRVQSLLAPDPALEKTCQGQCMFDLACRLNYGQKLGDCGGFYQVCCMLEGEERTFGDTIQEVKQLEMQKDYGPVQNEINCGRSAIATRRVVGGNEAGFGTFPWIALIMGTNSRCGGALIRASWIVTAGHCVKSEKRPSRYRVYLGEYSLYQNNEPLPRQKFLVSKIIIHPSYQFTPQADRYDLALMRLERPASLMPHVSPVCLPDPLPATPPGTRSMVAGWGATDPDSVSRPKVLQAVEVETIDNAVCMNWHLRTGIRVDVYPEMMCAGWPEGGRDACQGDSGGPLVAKDSSGRWVLIGVVSAGYSCAKPGQPGIYHRVTETASWISYITKNDL